MIFAETSFLLMTHSPFIMIAKRKFIVATMLGEMVKVYDYQFASRQFASFTREM
jgi:hypothetical protein